MVQLIRCLIFTLLFLAGGATADRSSLLVFAAASLTEVCASLGEAFESQEGVPVTFSFAGTSALARQIDRGAPAHVILSAHHDWILFLQERHRVTAEPTVFASNQLAVVTPAETSLVLDPSPEFDIAASFDGRIALADPDHVPAGRYAREALVSLGWWSELEGRLAIGHSVRAAFGYVERGACEVGVVYATDARLSDDVRIAAYLPDSLHTRIEYTAAVVGSQREDEAKAFVSFLKNEQAAKIIVDSGFRGANRVEGKHP